MTKRPKTLEEARRQARSLTPAERSERLAGPLYPRIEGKPRIERGSAVRKAERCCGFVIELLADARARVLWTDEAGGETDERLDDLETVDAPLIVE